MPFLGTANADNTVRFSYGTGTTGLHDEAYCPGWVLVGDLLKQGRSYAMLARVPEAELRVFVNAAIQMVVANDRLH